MGTIEEDTVPFFEVPPFGSLSFPNKRVSEGTAQIGHAFGGCFCDSLAGTLCFLFGFGELGDFRGCFDFLFRTLFLSPSALLSGPEGGSDLHGFFLGNFPFFTDVFHELVPSCHFL